MAVTKAEAEPSMEEILASIRRIISEEGEPETASDAPAAAPAAADTGDDVLELTEVVEDIPNRLVADAAEPEPEPEPEVEPIPTPSVAESFERLVTGAAAAQTASQFTSLARAAEPDPLYGLRGGRTVEEICVDLLRPMLREWLDANLPGIVERLVEREIRYLSRRPETE